MSPTHGAIVGGVVAVPNIDAALRDYRDVLGLKLVADCAVGEALATSWGCPANAASRMATLRPAVDLFFEKVLVNAPDLAVRENRLTLLFGLKTEFSGIAEFSEIVPKTQETHTS